jgi:glycosyltransferase involved in cell wall biosynthesis/peptidoglycan/xylan/chitin deacetylase (PgdA/CDA1 family)
MSESSTVRNLINYGRRLPFAEAIARSVLGCRSSVFLFYRILPQGECCYEEEMVTPKEAFGQLLDVMTENFHILRLEDLVLRREKSLGAKKPSCAITFDDGWVDNFAHAFPALRSRNLPATIFLPVRFIGSQRRFWQERMWLGLKQMQQGPPRQSLIKEVARRFPWCPLGPEVLASEGRLKRFLMTRPSEEAEEFVQHLIASAGLSLPTDRAFMNWDEVAEMQNSGISFGSHTLQHVLLTQIEPARAVAEIRESRRELQDRLGSEVSAFSYPEGAQNHINRWAVTEAGYRCAVGTHPGAIKDDVDPWVIPRMAISRSILSGSGNVNSANLFLFCAGNVVKARSRIKVKPRLKKTAERIKIVFIVDQIVEWQAGTEKQLHTLISLLDRQFFDPQLCFITRVAGFPEQTLPCEATWICDDPQNVPSFATRLLRLVAYLKKARPQIVQTFFIEGIIAGILAARLAKVPMIVGSARNAGHWKKRRHVIAFRSVAWFAHRWQCNSRSLWQYTKEAEHVSPRRIEILPNAIDISQFHPVTKMDRLACRRELRLPESCPVMVCVANLRPVKDIKTLLAAAHKIKPWLPAAQFVILGEGPLRKELEEQAERLGVAHMVRLIGRRADVKPYLAAADFGVLASRSEGSSNSVLEYMAMGLPCVVSDIPANRELVEGLFFTPGDPEDLANKLLLLYRDEILCAKLQKENVVTAQQYSLQRFVLRVQSYYSKLAAESDMKYAMHNPGITSESDPPCPV